MDHGTGDHDHGPCEEIIRASIARTEPERALRFEDDKARESLSEAASLRALKLARELEEYAASDPYTIPGWATKRPVKCACGETHTLGGNRFGGLK